MSALFQTPSWTEIGLSILSCLLVELEVSVSNEETHGGEKRQVQFMKAGCLRERREDTKRSVTKRTL